MVKTDENQRVRVQLDFTAAQIQVLDSIKENGDLSSRAAAIKRALRLYRWLLEQKQKGRILFLRGTDNELIEVKLLI